MNKETTFNFIIQSHSRTKEVVRLVKNINELKSHNINFNIILSDNGNRNFDDFKIHNRSVEYIYSNDCSSPYMHVFRIFSLPIENVFYVHDDDLFDIKKLLKAIDFIKINDPKVLVSPKFEIPSTKKFKSTSEVLKMYFLDHKNNCPLFSGFYIKSMSYIFDYPILDDLHHGKYGDVEVMSGLLNIDNAFLFNLPFVNYIEHNDNDNKLRSLDDRKKLSTYIKSNGGFTNYIISNLIFYGYPKMIHKLLFGIFLSFFNPFIFFTLLNKTIYKIFRL